MASAYKDYESQGRPLEPWGYIQSPAPMPPWSVVVDGHKITRRLVYKTLCRCRDAGVDMWYVADKLRVGRGAIATFTKNERSIPAWVARNFYSLFSSNEPLPHEPPPAPPDKSAYDEMFEDAKYKTTKFEAPDFYAESLGKVFVAERMRRGWSRLAVAKKIHTTSGSVIAAENGEILWVTNDKSILFRMCELYGIDIREFERKPRIDYLQFQELINEAKAAKGLKLKDIVEKTQVSHFILATYLNRGIRRREPVYLEETMTRIMNCLGVSPEAVIKREEKDFATGQHD